MKRTRRRFQFAPELDAFLSTTPYMTHDEEPAIMAQWAAVKALIRAAQLRTEGNRSWRDEAGIDRALSRLSRSPGRDDARRGRPDRTGARGQASRCSECGVTWTPIPGSKANVCTACDPYAVGP